MGQSAVPTTTIEGENPAQYTPSSRVKAGEGTPAGSRLVLVLHSTHELRHCLSIDEDKNLHHVGNSDCPERRCRDLPCPYDSRVYTMRLRR
jgi:hypothetical protein